MYHGLLLMRIPVMGLGALLAGWLYMRLLWWVVGRTATRTELSGRGS